MFLPRLVNYVQVIRQEFHDPPGIESFRILYLHQALERLMVSDNLECVADEIMSVVLNSPDDGKLFKLCYTIILFCSVVTSAGIADDSFSVDWFSILVEFSINQEVLSEDRS